MGLMESANSLMGHTIYEQRVLEKKAKLSEGFDGKISDEEEEVEEGLDSIVDMERAGPDDEDEEGLEGLEGGEEGEEEEESEMISVEDAIRAIQMIIDGSAETAEEAIEMVKAEGGEESEEGEEGEGLEGLEGLEGADEEDEVDEKFVVAKPKIAPNRMQEKSKKFTFGKKEISEEEDDSDMDTEIEECDSKGMKMKAKKADQYGESHSMFLQFAERYLK